MSIATEWPRVVTTPAERDFLLPPLRCRFESYALAIAMENDPASPTWVVNNFRFMTSPFSPLLEARLTVHRWGAQLRINGHIVDVAVTAERPIVRQQGEL